MNFIQLFGSVQRVANSSVLTKVGLQPTMSIINRMIHSVCNKQGLPAIAGTCLSNSKPLEFLQTTPTMYNIVRGMKVRYSLHRRCKDCYIVARHERLYVMCKTHPRHKQMSMKPKPYKTWILTSASQTPKRPW